LEVETSYSLEIQKKECPEDIPYLSACKQQYYYSATAVSAATVSAATVSTAAVSTVSAASVLAVLLPQDTIVIATMATNMKTNFFIFSKL
jgi:hypothetical protein